MPYNSATLNKKDQVADMFNNIAGNYDFLNHFLSLGIDILWRKKAVRILQKIRSQKKKSPLCLLDVATGTGDFALEAMKLKPEKIFGIDISENMLSAGRKKIAKLGHDKKIEFLKADSENLPFEENCFDAITAGFGVRNFENLDKGLSEMFRVLKSNGTIVILEFSQPQKFPVKQLYNFYFRYILPVAGKIISKDHRAYSYLPESVFAFPYGEAFLQKMKAAGYRNLRKVSLSFGIACLYFGEK